MFWHGLYFGVVDILAQSIFGAVNGLALSMLWHYRCFGPVDILERLMFWRSRTNAGER